MAEAAAAPAVKPKTVAKKPAAKKAEHPPTLDMVTAAITSLKERSGSSLVAIKKYITATYKIDAEKSNTRINKAVRKAVADKKLVQVKGSFKLAKIEKAEKPKKVVAKKSPAKPKKAAAAKPKTATKKSPAKPKKAAVAKPKAAAAKKSPAKPKKAAAAKPKAAVAAKKPTKPKTVKPKSPKAVVKKKAATPAKKAAPKKATK